MDHCSTDTSGSQPLAVLEAAAASSTGVLYPLQTFTKNKRIDFADIPTFVESGERVTEKVIHDLGRALTNKVFVISSPQRQAIHVAAVFASNFTNHMLNISQELMSRHKLEFDWLRPLIAETLNKSLSLGPEAAQTGPARRGDLEVLDRHLEFLNEDEGLAELYKVISQHILDRYNEG